MLPVINKNLHLSISALLIIIIALAYGLSPENILPKLFAFQVYSTDLKQVFRAIMGLYLSMACLWITGISKPAYWKTATISNICFMGGLAFGRVVSLVFDGLPNTYFLMGMMLEIILGLWGIKNLKQFGNHGK